MGGERLTLLALILTARWMTATLAPLDDERIELADAIAQVAGESEPLFRNDKDRTRTIGLLEAVAFREGSLRTSAIGDGGTSFCAFQIHKSSGGTIALTTDALACARAGYRMLHASIRICREHPVAWYAEGPRGCESPRAQRISADRMRLAASLTASLAR